MFHRSVHIYLSGALFLLLLIGCKHQQKQVTVVKKVPNQKVPVKNKPKDVEQGGRTPSQELQQKLGINQKQIRESKLYSFINEWYGVPYKYAGCQKSGVDCSCFANLLYDQVYGKKIARSAGEMFKTCDEVDIDHARIGDLVFFKIGGNSISHVGVFLNNKLFVHSSTSRGVIINSLEEAYYKKYFFCAGRVKNA